MLSFPGGLKLVVGADESGGWRWRVFREGALVNSGTVPPLIRAKKWAALEARAGRPGRTSGRRLVSRPLAPTPVPVGGASGRARCYNQTARTAWKGRPTGVSIVVAEWRGV